MFFIQISASSGRLQLVDATGSIDVIPDMSLNWNFNRIYEVLCHCNLSSSSSSFKKKINTFFQILAVVL